MNMSAGKPVRFWNFCVPWMTLTSRWRILLGKDETSFVVTASSASVELVEAVRSRCRLRRPSVVDAVAVDRVAVVVTDRKRVLDAIAWS